MSVQIQLRRDTAANWVAINPILAQGEKGYELDAIGTSEAKYKIGDGVSTWTALSYQVSGKVKSVNGEEGFVILDAQNLEVTDGGGTTIAQAITSVQGGLTAHESNISNPHGTTAAQVGADPSGSAAYVEGLLTTHKNDVANPHATTKAQVGLSSADNTSDADKPISDAQAVVNLTNAGLIGDNATAISNLDTDKQDEIVAGTTSEYFRGDKTFQELNKTVVGLPNVDNTSDEDKPVSTAQNTINGNLSTATSDVASDLTTHEGDLANPHGVTASQVGLGDVDNTSDANKPVSTATQTALDLKADQSDLDLTNVEVLANTTDKIAYTDNPSKTQTGGIRAAYDVATSTFDISIDGTNLL